MTVDPQNPWSGWDTETLHDLKDWRIRISGTDGYANTPLKKAMDEANGSPVTDILTRTFIEDTTMNDVTVPRGTVWLRAVPPKTPGARPFRPSETLSTAQFSFSVPLAKLGVKLPATRGLDFEVKLVEGQPGPTYSLSFTDYISKPLAVNEVALAAAKEARKEKARAKKKAPGSSANA